MSSPDAETGSSAAGDSLSGAYRRILKLAIALSVVAILAAALFFGWQSSLGVAIGSVIAYFNFVWLHRSTERMVSRMLEPGGAGRSKLRFAFPFPGRHLIAIAAAYVILKSYPMLLVGFLVGLILPIIASMGEGIYEAVVISKIDQASE